MSAAETTTDPAEAGAEPKREFFNDKVASQLAQQLRNGTSPLQRSGVQSIPISAATGRKFHGINALNLMMQNRSDSRWMTFDEANQNGYRVKKGEKATAVQYWLPKRNDEDKRRSVTAYVFNGEQLDGIPPEPLRPQQNPFERVNGILLNNGTTIIRDQKDRAYYAPKADEIHLPEAGSVSNEKLAEQALYQHFRALGHPDRLNRDSFSDTRSFQRKNEELVCTVATMMMCAEIGIPHDPARNPDLIESWAKSMEEYPIPFARNMKAVDDSVWSTLRQEQTHDRAIRQHDEAFDPILETSPRKMLDRYERSAQIIALSNTEPEKVLLFQHDDTQLFAQPGSGKLLQQQPTEIESQFLHKEQLEAFNLKGQACSVVLVYTATHHENGLWTHDKFMEAEVTPTMEMVLPPTWDGKLEVRGCDEEQGIPFVVDPQHGDEPTFYGVYATQKDGPEQRVQYFHTKEDAELFKDLASQEHERQTGRENESSKEQTSRHTPAQREVAVTEARDECIAAMKKVDMIVTDDHPIFDKKSHRIEVEGDKKGEKSGFYVAHPDGRPSGYVKNNRTGEEIRWSHKGYILDDAQKKALHKEALENVAKREETAQETADRAAERVQKQMKGFKTPNEPTPYMQTKGIALHAGVLENGNSTCIPIHDVNGNIRSMAYLNPDGPKRYAKDSEKHGCFHAVDGLDALKKAPAIVISEGYATAATLSESIGMGTVAAFDAGNLVPVAKTLREAFPDKPIIIAADNDTKLAEEKGRNPGVIYAKEAAEAVSGIVITPRFAKAEQNSKEFTDFNDLAHRSKLGKEAVEKQVKPVVEKEIKKLVKTQEKARDKTKDQKQQSKGR